MSYVSYVLQFTANSISAINLICGFVFIYIHQQWKNMHAYSIFYTIGFLLHCYCRVMSVLLNTNS